jgi:hypothetical protein
MATKDLDTTGRPWFREPWPWIIIGLLGSVILASLVTLWIAATNPDGMVVGDAEYQEIRRGLRAQDSADRSPTEAPNGEPGRRDDSG